MPKWESAEIKIQDHSFDREREGEYIIIQLACYCIANGMKRVYNLIEVIYMKNMVQARIEKELAEEAEQILSDLGLNRTTAIKVFYQQIVLNQGLPFEIKKPYQPNEETVAAINEDLSNQKRYTDLNEMWNDLED
ncbi:MULTISPECIES: type II toxin-antitoxin system RelB/DinJ family antitoxin [unclassified Enterococcus]|uniref:type II toxin-antitoxin system RelB/DinJ family antitoxin n=1 Tax=unclassified Enterococcus TaxID=2608891 RepID=UPI001903234F|nr:MULTISPECIES: type II toxin-antitoxin system RelB/DinJ family antitoxin [unclassified Enterococcus]MBK0036035.1 type II toxin-antitoxin system RelB/DinJ family antitoxin [Enterococcus sp. S52]MBK0068693.1 type II toxin-antitoxin system RelB/DinJ family antitoxin [Enterococcus sp. S53]MBK0139286.1 type II toxin-antitoxin system RelB/DinJ family antitoxin [Enterococcus sp. S76]MBK0142921.1 type II toxin-antitoxin system RelB/DinJ family antitoxin [Enterococcus sp. S77]